MEKCYESVCRVALEITKINCVCVSEYRMKVPSSAVKATATATGTVTARRECNMT